MASGFITLPDGTDWHARWTGYDLVLQTIADRLDKEGDEGYLKSWLNFIIPDEAAGDVENGYCFFKKIDDEHECIIRQIDTRLLKEHYKEIFWRAVYQLSQELNSESPGAGYLIHTLQQEYQESLSLAGKAPEFDPAIDDIYSIGGFNIGIS